MCRMVEIVSLSVRDIKPHVDIYPWTHGWSCPALAGSLRLGKQDKYLSMLATPPDLYSNIRQRFGRQIKD